MLPELPEWTQPAAERKRMRLAAFGTVGITALSVAIGKLFRDRTNPFPGPTCYMGRFVVVEEPATHNPLGFPRLTPVLTARATPLESSSFQTAEEHQVWSELQLGLQKIMERTSSQPHLFRILSQLEALAAAPKAVNAALEARILDGLARALRTALFPSHGDRGDLKLRLACRRVLKLTLTQARALDQKGKPVS